MTGRTITRRDFLRTTGAAVVAAAAAPSAGAWQDRGPTARVVLIRARDVLDAGGRMNREIGARMLDEAMCSLFNVESADRAWKQIVAPSDVVGIKTNVWRYLRTPEELEQVIMERLGAAGVRNGEIGLDDRGILSNPVFRRATALINVRPMRAHHWSGVGGCLKNYIMFVPRPSDYHAESCRDLGAIWNLPGVKGKTRLNILVMLTPQFHCRGPHHFDEQYTWRYNGLLVGTDPVALDAVGLKIIEEKRHRFFGGVSPIRAAARHITAAEERHGVGIADLKRVDVVKLGWDHERFI